MAKDLEICHSSLIKKIRKNSSEYGYDAKLAQKIVTLEFAKKTTLNLNLKFITPKKWQLKALWNLSSVAIALNVLQLKRFTIKLIQKFEK
ncbi:hypothetical protein MSGX11T_02799 [Mycoplasma synoviae GX11-T]|nr:hypothetical protein [Mycoplasmopsis synoviae]MBD5788924.1 hypothetical protein [Mycoplasmopsis synoviae GX11-T]